MAQEVLEVDFNLKSLELFNFQKKNNELYAYFLSLLNLGDFEPKSWKEIPCIPISFFKHHKLYLGDRHEESKFESSGTSKQNKSYHYIPSLINYHKNAQHIFEASFGPLTNFEFLALLPGYTENPNSSLISMVEYFIKNSRKSDKNYFLKNKKELIDRLENTILATKIIVFGVSHAILDLIDYGYNSVVEFIIIETGGMKGLKKEMPKEEVFQLIHGAFPNAKIYSEYGMTELQSQFYTEENSLVFNMNDRAKVRIMEPNDPFALQQNHKNGVVNIVDLANAYTMPFIATEDIGVVLNENQFKILGRLDHADLRGCNLLLQ